MTKLTVTSPPDEEPVSLDEAKSYLRIGHEGEDQLASEMIVSARSRLEQVAGLALVRQTVQLTWLQWPAEIAGRGARLPVSPIQQLESVAISDQDDTLSDHTDRFQVYCGRLRLRPWSMLPSVAPAERIEITLQAGFGAASKVPGDLREAVLKLIAATYASRRSGAPTPDMLAGLPQDVQSILDARKEVRL